NILTTFITIIFFFNDPATTEIYTLSLHDALPICKQNVNYLKIYGNVDVRQVDLGFRLGGRVQKMFFEEGDFVSKGKLMAILDRRSEEHTSELQSRGHLVCRLLLEKKKKN